MDTVVGIATRYGQYGPAIEPRLARDFPYYPYPPTQHTVHSVEQKSIGLKFLSPEPEVTLIKLN